MKQQLLQKFEEKLNEIIKTSKNLGKKPLSEVFDDCLDGEIRDFRNFLSEAISQTEREEKERQYDMMMKCLPSDAENLSTLTPDQAFRLIKCFIKKNPWG